MDDSRSDFGSSVRRSTHTGFSVELGRETQTRDQFRTKYCSHLTAAIPPLCLLALWIALTLGTLSSNNLIDDLGCDPNGNFVAGYNSTNASVWDPAYTFTVTLASGSFSYATAKIIDECWNLVVGRGCQALAAAASYYIFRPAIARSLRCEGMPYRTALALQYSPVSVSSVWRYTCDSLSRAIESGTAAALLIPSTVFVLALPTWLSAMTGYQATSKPIMAWPNSTFISADMISPPCYAIVKDGSRVGLGDYACVDSEASYEAVEDYLSNMNMVETTTDWVCNENISYHPAPIELDSIDWIMTNKSSNFTAVSSLDQKTATANSTNGTYMLGPPTLRVAEWLRYTRAVTGESNPPCSPSATRLYTYNGFVFDYQYVFTNGICQPQKTYQWGFSFLLTFAFLVTLTVFTIALELFWFLRQRGVAEVENIDDIFGSLRTAVTVAQHLQMDFSRDVDAMPQEQLSQAVSARSKKLRQDARLERKKYERLLREAPSSAWRVFLNSLTSHHG